jgi:small subunit ribosomal protein S16
MLVIRLARVGKKNSPAYRVVVADKRRAVKRKFIEILGSYNPTRQPKELAISKERAIFWMNRGAQPSDTVRNLMVDLLILPKDEKAKIVYGKEKAKKTTEGKADKKPTEPAAAAGETVKDDSETEESVEEATAPTAENVEVPAEGVEKETVSEVPARNEEAEVTKKTEASAEPVKGENKKESKE